MAQVCPLLFRQVDATVTRINTFFVISGVLFYLFSGAEWILVMLIIDFLLRLYGYKKFSPTQRVSLLIQNKLNLSPKMEDAGAKRLAAYFGTAFMIAMTLCDISGMEWIGYFIAMIYLACAGLDLFFGFCIACKIYYFSKKIYPKGFE